MESSASISRVIPEAETAGELRLGLTDIETRIRQHTSKRGGMESMCLCHPAERAGSERIGILCALPDASTRGFSGALLELSLD